MTHRTDEIWKPVVGAEGRYSVSNHGRVRSESIMLIGADGVKQPQRGQIRKLQLGSDGRPIIRFRFASDLPKKTISVSHLVAEAFIGPRPDGLDICHFDGDPTNNNPDNLRYDTRSANILDAVRHGTHAMTRKTHCKWGHEFTPENTYKQTHGGRACRTCSINRATAFNRKLLAKRSGL